MADSRVILVTGSSRGIGAGLVTGFANKGFRVAINYSKSAGEANTLSREIAEIAGQDRVMVIQCDVSKRRSVRDMFDSIIRKFGRVDVLVDNSIPHDKDLH